MTIEDQTGSFLKAYVAEVSASLGNDHQDNFDEIRFGKIEKKGLRSQIRGWSRQWLNKFGLVRASTCRALVEAAIALVESALPKFETVYKSLANDESRALLVKILAFRALGNRWVKLPVNTPAYWSSLLKYESVAEQSQSIDSTFRDSKLFLMDLSPADVRLRMYSLPICATTLIDLHQYRCDRPFVVEVGAGDYIIDGGGCWGDAALIFGAKAGPQGRVFSFEFVPANLQIFRKNLSLNPEIASRISIEEYALWDRSGEMLEYNECGPSTTVGHRSGNAAKAIVPTVTIDEFCQRTKMERVDFIKLDIEGAELNALRGAADTLRAFKPKLAVCIYHKLEDFYQIPDFLNALNLGYKLSIGHYTIHSEETVLYGYAGT